MCSHCREGKGLETEFGSLSITITDNKLCIDYNAYSCDSSFYQETEIKFCPMCGHELN